MRKTKILIGIYIIAAVLRLWIGALLGVWFPGNQGGDDTLMILYSAFPNYFKNMEPGYLMLKELGLPLFYQLVNVSGLTYPTALSVLWIIDGLLASRLVNRISGSKICALCTYIFTVFTPAAFEVLCGTRLYRAGLLMPMYVMLLLMCFFMLLRIKSASGREGVKGTLGLSLLIGLVFSFVYYIKEDGIWVLAVLAAFACLWLIEAFMGFAGQKKVSGLLLALTSVLLPFCIFVGATLSYKAVNYRFFGVFETNIRTSGESGKFVENMYKIAADDRTNAVWSPKSAIEKAFEASATLNAHPELKEYIYTSQWVSGDIDSNPVRGDGLTWILKDALFDCGIATNLAEKEAFFLQVNKELNAAFKSGALAKEKARFTVISSVGGKTKEEIATIAKRAFEIYGYHVLLKDYEFGGNIIQDEMTNVYMPATIIVNYPVLPINEPSAIYAREFELKIVNPFVTVIFAVGKVLIPVLLVVAFVGIIIGLIRPFGKKKTVAGLTGFFVSLAALGLLAVSYVYNFMIMLFCTQYDGKFVMAEKMYSVGTVALLSVVITVGLSQLAGLFSKEAKQ